MMMRQHPKVQVRGGWDVTDCVPKSSCRQRAVSALLMGLLIQSEVNHFDIMIIFGLT